jgi:hypothetical protein
MSNENYDPEELQRIGYFEARKLGFPEFDTDDLASEFVVGALIASQDGRASRSYQYSYGMNYMMRHATALRKNARREHPTDMRPGIHEPAC